MADKVIAFGSSEGFGAFAGWECTGTTDATAKTLATQLNEIGMRIAKELYNEKQDVTSNYVCVADTNTVPDTIGNLVNDLMLTGINFATSNTSRPTMALTGHNHTTAAHTDTLMQVLHGITIAKCWGTQDFTGDSVGTNDAPVSSSCNITCEHSDQQDGDGENIVGENYDGKIEVKTTYAGTHTAVATGFNIISDPVITDENTGFQKSEVTAEKALTLAAPA